MEDCCNSKQTFIILQRKIFLNFVIACYGLTSQFEKSIKIDKISKEIGFHYILYIKHFKVIHNMFFENDSYLLFFILVNRSC